MNVSPSSQLETRLNIRFESDFKSAIDCSSYESDQSVQRKCDASRNGGKDRISRDDEA